MSEASIKDRWPEPPKNRTERIKHFLDVFEDLPDDYMILLSTAEVYGHHIRTGVSIGDLRQCYNLERLGSETVAGPTPAAKLLGRLERPPEETGTGHRPNFSD